MKILYVARHDGAGNDDEGAIAHAMTALGHSVIRMDERAVESVADVPTSDVAIFHKVPNLDAAGKVRCPKCFWFFDVVTSDQWDLKDTNEVRERWVRRATQIFDVGFLTDGDWVDRDDSGKLVWLPQGCDERIMGSGRVPRRDLDLLFVGSIGHGGRRAEWFRKVSERYQKSFTVVGMRKSGRVHGRPLADLMARAKIVLAPDGPQTDRYWSNRVYQALGFGAFVLHPYCRDLMAHYSPNKEIVYYHPEATGSYADLFNSIDYYLSRPQLRDPIAMAGLHRTASHHTYRHRCAQLIEVLRGRGLI